MSPRWINRLFFFHAGISPLIIWIISHSWLLGSLAALSGLALILLRKQLVRATIIATISQAIEEINPPPQNDPQK